MLGRRRRRRDVGGAGDDTTRMLGKTTFRQRRVKFLPCHSSIAISTTCILVTRSHVASVVHIAWHSSSDNCEKRMWTSAPRRRRRSTKSPRPRTTSRACWPGRESSWFCWEVVTHAGSRRSLSFLMRRGLPWLSRRPGHGRAFAYALGHGPRFVGGGSRWRCGPRRAAHGSHLRRCYRRSALEARWRAVLFWPPGYLNITPVDLSRALIESVACRPQDGCRVSQRLLVSGSSRSSELKRDSLDADCRSIYRRCGRSGENIVFGCRSTGNGCGMDRDGDHNIGADPLSLKPLHSGPLKTVCNSV